MMTMTKRAQRVDNADNGGAGTRHASRGTSASRSGSFDTVPDASTEIVGERASNTGVIVFSSIVFAASFCIVLGLCWMARAHSVDFTSVVLALIVAALCTMSVHIAEEWERVVVLRLGKFDRVAGPGMFFTIPVIESNTMRIDDRVRVTTFGAEETLTSDLVPLDVDAVLFWVVWDAEKACTEVGDFTRAVEMSAQTALRDAIGRGSAAEVAIRRNQLDREIKDALTQKVDAWGISVLSVEVRNIVLPKELQDVMSLEAQAEQRKKARIILMEAEQDISEMLDEVGQNYDDNDAALRLRAMHLLYESVRETGGTVVVPSSFSEGFGDVLPDNMADALGHKAGKKPPAAQGK